MDLAERMREALTEAVTAGRRPIEWRVHPGAASDLLWAKDQAGNYLINSPAQANGDRAFFGLPLWTDPEIGEEEGFRLRCRVSEGAHG